MRYREVILGILVATLVFVLFQGVNIVPLIALIGLVGLLYLLFNRGFYDLAGNFGVLNVGAADHAVSFDDIGGQDIAKQELLEVLDFNEDLDRVNHLGIRPLRGILLTGPPGTGKTLLAKAAAAYTNSVFVAAAGSEFVEMYAGVGAQRVRKLFAKARKTADKMGKHSAVVFIDEIEVIAGKRGAYNNHLEYDQTLNQLLVEMDGVKNDDAVHVVIIAATNRADLLDSAILRPGRFDRQVKVDLPDREGRKCILDIYAKGKPLSSEINLAAVAGETFGFSGAHLESLINEAAIMAFRRNHSEILQEDIHEAIDKVMLGEKIFRKIDHEELKRVSIHEVGHALVSEILRPGSVAGVTVIPRGKALGFMRQAQRKEQYLYTKNDLEMEISIALGGALAEELVYGDWSTGAGNDFEQATSVCRTLILNGLSELGIIREELVGNERIFQMMQQILGEQEERVRGILEEHESVLYHISHKLLEEENVSGEWFRKTVTKGLEEKRMFEANSSDEKDEKHEKDEKD